jgi:signal peptidase II
LARSPRAKINSRALLVLALVAGGGLASDQISKALVVSTMTEGDTARVLGDVLQWRFIRNPGAAFSFATGLTWVFTLLAAGVVVFIGWFARRIRSRAWAAVPAIYNVADACIVVSMVVFVSLTLRGIGLDGRRRSADGAPVPATAVSTGAPAPLITPN